MCVELAAATQARLPLERLGPLTLGFLVAKHDRRHGCSRRWPSLDRLSRVLFSERLSGAPSVCPRDCPSTGVPFAIVPRPWFRMILVQRRMRSERGGGRGPKFVSRFLKPVRLGRLRTPVRVQARVSMYVHACHVARASLSAALVSVHHDHTNALTTPLHSHNQQTPCSPRTCTRTQTCPTSIHPQSSLGRTDRTALAGRSERRGACVVRCWRSKSVA